MVELEDSWRRVVRSAAPLSDDRWDRTATSICVLLEDLLEDAISIAPRGEARRADIQEIRDRIVALISNDR